jgi:hypothetical protein
MPVFWSDATHAPYPRHRGTGLAIGALCNATAWSWRPDVAMPVLRGSKGRSDGERALDVKERLGGVGTSKDGVAAWQENEIGPRVGSPRAGSCGQRVVSM